MLVNARAENMLRNGFGPQIMKRWKVCPVCGLMGSADQLACHECGKTLPNETLFDLYKGHHNFCTICETVVQSNNRYCPLCGARIL